MKRSILLFSLLWLSLGAHSQTAAPAFNFLDYQKAFPRISEALKKREDTLMKQFRAKKLDWPARNIYLRSFKYDSQLEVWVKNEKDGKYRLFKTYRVCALAGTLGPKRMQGDYQVPEGFYYINEFNPRSLYHLSLGLNYPNASDRLLGDSLQPGGDIYIHGKCVTSGCIPIMDPQIEELYILAAHAHNEGQDFIPVHIFPIDFNNERSNGYLSKYLRQFPEYTRLAAELKSAFGYFEKTRKLPVVLTGSRGEYIIANTEPPREAMPVTPPAPQKLRRPLKTFREEDIARVVDKLPVFPGGGEGFQQFLNKLSADMVPYLDSGQARTFVMLDFIIDKDGKPAYAKVIRGGNDEMNDRLQERFENMPAWEPATRLEKKVAIRLKQSLEIGLGN